MSYDYNNLNVGKLDYSGIKSNLVAFLKKYPKFTNFDFDNPTSSVGIFLDILAANTAYNGYYLQSVLTNAFPYTASTKRLLLLNANLRGALVGDTVSARCTISVQNNGSSSIPIFSTFLARQTNNVPCFFYNTEAIPVTGSNTVTVNMVAGKQLTSFSNFNFQTKSLELPLQYDPTAVALSTIADSTLTETYWTRVDTYTSSTASKIFTVINGPNSYLVTTNVAGAETPPNIVKVYAVESSGSLGNSAIITGIQNYTGVTITNQTTAVGGRDASSVSYLKTYIPYMSATKDRLVTQTDYIDSIYSFLISKGLTLEKSTISVTSPTAGEILIYVPALTSASIQNELMTSYLPTKKMAGISIRYGAS